MILQIEEIKNFMVMKLLEIIYQQRKLIQNNKVLKKQKRLHKINKNKILVIES